MMAFVTRLSLYRLKDKDEDDVDFQSHRDGASSFFGALLELLPVTVCSYPND